MKLYTVTSVIGVDVKVLKGKRNIVERFSLKDATRLKLDGKQKTEGVVSSRSRCEEFRTEHLDLGHHVSCIKRWLGGSRTHHKSRSGKNIETKNELRKKRK